VDLDPFIEGLPSVAAAVIRSDEIETDVAGAAQLDDRFHLGSNTKAMTATLAAIAVDRGLLDWDSKATDVLKADGSAEITLVRLLAHAGGIRPLTDDAEFIGLPTGRAELARVLTREAPLFQPGTENVYSNGGYAIVAAMLETVSGIRWEGLLQSWLAEPLSIELGGGWPRGLAGHYERDDKLVPHDRTDGYTVPVAIAPAGDVNATIGSYSRFVQLHLRGLRGQAELLSRESFEFLHTPMGEPFALGWGVQSFEGARSSVHAGSAGTFTALAVVQPERDLAVVVLTNAGGQHASATAVAATRELIRAHT
jgi:CubicO group peptidase (beta-lactamase class C family)